MDELREEAAQDPENDSLSDGELPDYMLRMIQQFEVNDIVVVEDDEVYIYIYIYIYICIYTCIVDCLVN